MGSSKKNMKISTVSKLKVILILSVLIFDVVSCAKRRTIHRPKYAINRQALANVFTGFNGQLGAVGLGLIIAGALGATAAWTERRDFSTKLTAQRKEMDGHVTTAERACAAVRDIGNVQAPEV